MKKTLGGDRLGSGKKMKVEMKDFGRSTHDLSRVIRTSASPGTLIPFLREVVLDGDTVDIDLSTLVRTLPTVGPLFGSFKLQLDLFEVPFRLYIRELHNAKLGVGRMMNKMALPYCLTSAVLPNWGQSDPNQSQINPSSLSAYLGLRGLGRPATGQAQQTQVTRKVQMMPWLMYNDIYKNYYANKQEGTGALIIASGAETRKPIITSMGTGYGPLGGATTSYGTVYPDATGNAVQRIPIPLVDNSKITVSGSGLRNLAQLFVPGYANYASAQGDITLLTDLMQYKGTSPGAFWVNDEGTIMEVDINAIAIDQGLTALWTPNPGLVVYGTDHPDFVAGLNGSAVPDTSADFHPGIKPFDLTLLDDLREQLLSASGAMQGGVDISTLGTVFEQVLQYQVPRSYDSTAQTTEPAQSVPNGGLLLKTYQSDRFNAWLDQEAYNPTFTDSITYLTRIDTTGGNFTMDQLNLVQKLYNLLNRVQASGNSYEDWREAAWGGAVARRYETPMYIGGMSAEVQFDEVVSLAQTGSAALGENGALGSIGGRGSDRQHKGGKIRKRIEEPGYIIGIMSLTPRIDYTNGNKWDLQLQTMDDLHKPDLDQIGMQDLVTDEVAAWDTQLTSDGTPQYAAFAKQPAWTEYTTAVNEAFGDFAIDGRGQFMTLSRRYRPVTADASEKIADLTTIVDPNKYNYAFANREANAQNFWIQVGIDLHIRRKMAAKQMPIL